MNGGTTYGTEITDGAIVEPQWSPPMNGGTTAREIRTV
jgi:hypothetical protein